MDIATSKRRIVPDWPGALALLFTHQRNLGERVPLTVVHAGRPIDLYCPSGHERGTVVFVHGMSSRGREDPRVRSLAWALAATGRRVVVPEIPSIRRLTIRVDQPREVQAVLETIASDPALVPADRFALMAVSFSGVFALRAVCSKALGGRVNAACLIGGYFDIDTVISFLINSNRSDPYGRLLIARSYFTDIEPKGEAFHHHLDRCIERSATNQPGWSLRELLDPAEPQQQQLYQLLSDSAERQAFCRQVMAAFDDDWSDYRAPQEFGDRRTPVFLLHGRGDRVIPAGESRRLARQLAEQRVPCYLCVTRLLEHGDSAISLYRLQELYRLLAGFAWFLGSCLEPQIPRRAATA